MILMVLLCIITRTSSAMMNITDHMVGSAQEYGKVRIADTITMEEFQKPWTVDEISGKNIYAVKEHIILYTPYLLVAMDAQNKARAYEMVKAEDGKALADDFKGILVVGAIIDAPERITAEKLEAYIVQNDIKLPTYHVELIAANSTQKVVNKKITINEPEKSKKGKQSSDAAENIEKVETVSVKMPVWNLQYYLYFDLDQLNSTLPMSLFINDDNAGERQFKFHLVSMD